MAERLPDAAHIIVFSDDMANNELTVWLAEQWLENGRAGLAKQNNVIHKSDNRRVIGAVYQLLNDKYKLSLWDDNVTTLVVATHRVGDDVFKYNVATKDMVADADLLVQVEFYFPAHHRNH